MNDNLNTLNHVSFLSEIQTKVENVCVSWNVAWLGKILCSPITYFILFYLCIASNEIYWQVYTYHYSNHKQLRCYNGNDTNTYTCCNCNLLKGETDQVRTPVYPLFLKCITRFSTNETILDGNRVLDEKGNLIEDNSGLLIQGWHTYCIVVIFQFLINLLAFIFFFYACKGIINNSALHLLVMAYIARCFISYHLSILTESLAISGVLCFFSLFILYLKRRSALVAGTISIFTLILVMLRPFFIFLTGLLFFFWALRFILYRQERRSACVGLLCLFITCFAIHGYCELNKKNYGVYELTCVSTTNRFVILYGSNLYMRGTDTEIIDFMTNYKNINPDGCPYHLYMKARDKFGYLRVKTFVTNTTKSNLLNFITTELKRLYWGRLEGNFYYYYGVLFIEFIVIAILTLKYKIFPWLRLSMWGFFLGWILLMFMGSYDAYPRLIVPALPICILIAARYYDLLFMVYSHTKDEIQSFLKSTL